MTNPNPFGFGPPQGAQAPAFTPLAAFGGPVKQPLTAAQAVAGFTGDQIEMRVDRQDVGVRHGIGGGQLEAASPDRVKTGLGRQLCALRHRDAAAR